MKLGGWRIQKLRARLQRWVVYLAYVLSRCRHGADMQILGQHQLALEGLTGLLNRMEFDEGVIAKGLTELGEARH